jgi:hypothetical protein
MTCQLLQDDLLGYGWLMRVVQPYMRQGAGRRGGRVGAVPAGKSTAHYYFKLVIPARQQQHPKS